MTVAIVDYGSGNLRSAAKAFERMTGQTVLVTPEAAAVAAADRIVLPGQGAFGDCWRGLAALDGMVDALNEAILERGRPFLGICVGMQLMATEGLEHGRHPGLGWIPGSCVAIEPADAKLKIPHMGWNELHFAHPHPVFDGLPEGEHVYFVHSYEMRPDDPHAIIATTDYGGSVTAAVGRDNMVGTQFHPEKSQHAGLRIIENFLAWRP